MSLFFNSANIIKTITVFPFTAHPSCTNSCTGSITVHKIPIKMHRCRELWSDNMEKVCPLTISTVAFLSTIFFSFLSLFIYFLKAFLRFFFFLWELVVWDNLSHFLLSLCLHLPDHSFAFVTPPLNYLFYLIHSP